jgi:exosome complex RNA-binding protein Csl4
MERNLVREAIEKYVPKTLFKGQQENFELLHIMKQLDQLEAKAQELDRRENGALVVNENVLGVDYLMCSNCGALAGNKYCDNCGFKLNFPESEDE